MKGVLLHGGFGTRLRPLTHSGPKQLVRVAGFAVSEWCLRDLVSSGIENIAVVLGEVSPLRVVDYFGDGSRLGVSITYIFQGYPYGLAHAVSLVKNFVGDEPFVVYLGDNILIEGIREHVKKFESSDADAMVLLARVANPERFGVARFEDGRLVGFVEKPRVPPSSFALVGVYFFRPSHVFEVIEGLRPSWRGELEITDALQGLIDKGYKVDYSVVKGWWKDTGTPSDILEANRMLLDYKYPRQEIKGEVRNNAIVEGRVVLDKSAIVEGNSIVRGPVYIGRGSVVRDSYVGPYTSIGVNCVLEGVEVENSVILDNVVLRNLGERVEDSIIGSESHICGVNARPRGSRFIVGENTRIML